PLQIEGKLLEFYTVPDGQPAHHLTHDAGDAAAIQARRRKPAPVDQKNIAHAAGDARAAAREQQYFGDARIRPLEAGEDLLQAIEVLDSRECRVLAEPQLAPAPPHALARRGWAGRVTQQYPRAPLRAADAIAARVRRPARHDQFEDGAGAFGGRAGDFLRQGARLRGGNRQTRAAGRQALEVQVEEARAARNAADGLKEAV